MPHYIVEEIDFDFDEEFISKDERIEITQDCIGLWWVDAEERFLYDPVLTPEESLIEKITEKTGWCVKSIKYVPNQPHRLTAYM